MIENKCIFCDEQVSECYGEWILVSKSVSKKKYAHIECYVKEHSDILAIGKYAYSFGSRKNHNEIFYSIINKMTLKERKLAKFKLEELIERFDQTTLKVILNDKK